jgi:hypothetical protein
MTYGKILDVGVKGSVINYVIARTPNEVDEADLVDIEFSYEAKVIRARVKGLVDLALDVAGRPESDVDTSNFEIKECWDVESGASMEITDEIKKQIFAICWTYIERMVATKNLGTQHLTEYQITDGESLKFEFDGDLIEICFDGLRDCLEHFNIDDLGEHWPDLEDVKDIVEMLCILDCKLSESKESFTPSEELSVLFFRIVVDHLRKVVEMEDEGEAIPETVRADLVKEWGAVGEAE